VWGGEQLLLAINVLFYSDCSSSFSSQSFHSNINVERQILTVTISAVASLSLQMYKSQEARKTKRLTTQR
jgi:hypothetical protein